MLADVQSDTAYVSEIKQIATFAQPHPHRQPRPFPTSPTGPPRLSPLPAVLLLHHLSLLISAPLLACATATPLLPNLRQTATMFGGGWEARSARGWRWHRREEGQTVPLPIPARGIGNGISTSIEPNAEIRSRVEHTTCFRALQGAKYMPPTGAAQMSPVRYRIDQRDQSRTAATIAFGDR